MHVIHILPNNESGIARSGTIIGVGTYSGNPTLNAQAFADAGLAAITLPSDMDDFDVDTLIGTYLSTSFSAGLHPASTFADEAAFLADATLKPEKYRNRGLFMTNNGFGWVVNATQKGGGEPATLTITDAGNGYAIGAGINTTKITGDGTGMTVEITSVGGNGDITGVTVTEPGIGYAVGDTIGVQTGAGNAVLTVGSLILAKIGQINTGRGASNQASADDLNPSYFTELPFGLAENEIQLYVPSSGQIISYDNSLPAPYKFDSFGDCFVGGDYTLEIRRVSDGSKIAEVTVPGPQDVNSNIDFEAA